MLGHLRNLWIDIAICIVGVVAYVWAADMELFEEFYDFTRAHEDWDLDEIVLVYAVGAVILPVLLVRSRFRLKRAMSATVAAKQEAQHIARHDALTGLFNRRYFLERLEDTIRDASADNRPIVFLLDLDRFKAVNDLRGHDVGDRVLQEVTRRIQGACGPQDCPCRLGGDEFAILMTGNPEFKAAASLARRLITLISEPIDVEGWQVTVGASIGISAWQDGEGAAAWLRNADHAMYKAKNEGRGRYMFYKDDLGEEIKRQALLEDELQIAVCQNQIEPHFQPIMNLTDGSILGFEVLARWSSPSLGPVDPEVFIGLAEEMGLIADLTWHVVEQSLSIASDWDDDVFVAFNLSPLLFDDVLVVNMTRCIEKAGFDPHRIEIEITESAVIGNMDLARSALVDLKELGLRISLDDFGTGFSSLSTLNNLPFDKIKIDKSFVSDLDAIPQNAKIVGAIVALAKSLDIQVTAEGIETVDELEFLSNHECWQGQGFLFSKPLKASAAERYMSGKADHRPADLQRKAV